MLEHMLTTIDNPFNPFVDFDQWFQFDVSKGYNSSNLLARVCLTSDSLSEYDQSLAIEDAITEIVEENVSGVHVKITLDQEPLAVVLPESYTVQA